ncbi:gluconokinase [Okibacterium endophyticum]
MGTSTSSRARALRGPDGSSTPLLSIGIDIGSTNTKIALIAADAGEPIVGDAGIDAPHTEVRELETRSFPTPASAPDLLTGVMDAIRDVVQVPDGSSDPTDPVTSGQPVTIGISSMAETGVALDADGLPLTPLIHWNRRRPNDAHTAGVSGSTVFDEIGPEEFFAATGVQPVPKAPLAVWHGLRRDDPALWRRMAHWAGVADLLALELTGTLATDHTLAGRTGAYLLPAFGEPVPAGFDPWLLSVVGLAPYRLATVTEPGEPAGGLTRAAAQRTGLAPGLPVYVCGHDHAVGAWGAGVREPGQVADSLGTSEALLRVLERPVDRLAVSMAGMSLTRTVSGTHENLLAGTSGAGFLIEKWFPDGVPSGLAGELPGALMVLPYPAGRQTPHPDAGARARLVDVCGRPVHSSRCTTAELWTATLVGMCLQLRWMNETQRALIGEDCVTDAGGADGGRSAIRILGAPADNADWLRMKSLVLDAPLSRVEATQTVASSAGLLALVHNGRVPADATLPLASVTDVIPSDAQRSSPAAAEKARLEEMFAAFVDAARAGGAPDDDREPTADTGTRERAR